MATIVANFEGRLPAVYDLEHLAKSAERGEIFVGRDAGCAIHIDYPAISRLHCAFVKVLDSWLLRDLGSENKTFINGLEITGERRLKDGDVIVVGKFKLVFSAVGVDTAPATFRVGPSNQAIARSIAEDEGKLERPPAPSPEIVQLKNQTTQISRQLESLAGENRALRGVLKIVFVLLLLLLILLVLMFVRVFFL